MKDQYIFNLNEENAANMLGITIQTIRNWRRNGTLPDYLYRKFGKPSYPKIRYCQLLLLRWQSIDIEERQSEEVWARAQLIKSLQAL